MARHREDMASVQKTQRWFQRSRGVVKKASGARRRLQTAGTVTLTRRAAQSQPERKPLEPRPSNRPDDFQRTIRPRPLHVEDQMRVFWGNSDPDLRKIDGGAFAKWLQSHDQALQGLTSGAAPSAVGAAQDQTRVCGLGMLDRPHASGSLAASLPQQRDRQPSAAASRHRLAQPAPAALEAPSICIPSYRTIERRPGMPSDAGVCKGSEASHTAGYIRYVAPTPEEQEAMLEYDMDSDDEEWLAQYERQLSSRSAAASGRAASGGKPKPGARRKYAAASQVQGHGASPTIEAPDRLLHEETFERTMDRLEKAHHAALQAMSSTQNLQPGHPLPSAETVLDMDAAFTACEGLLPEHVEAVYRHWLTKQMPTRRPLLQRLWFQPPWQGLGLQWGASKLPQGPSAGPSCQPESDGEECLPFVGKDSPPPGPAARLPAMSNEETRLRLEDARSDLERLRTLVDQVRRRERIKRRLAEVRQREIMLRFQPPPRAMLSASLPPKPALDPLAHGPVDPGCQLGGVPRAIGSAPSAAGDSAAHFPQPVGKATKRKRPAAAEAPVPLCSAGTFEPIKEHAARTLPAQEQSSACGGQATAQGSISASSTQEL
ncbi:hypothetical protein WJX84_002361 [Apatococcus fuscideae]|uniref:Enhancer of polycomb-like protein n=1 Tax=Apatococcus fuscideae TaxID=2026836 RepID=A0AAW1T9D9_9CHLO